jgi:hypothetical protein
MTEQLLLHKLNKYYHKLNSGYGDLDLYQKKIYYYEYMIGGNNKYDSMNLEVLKTLYITFKEKNIQTTNENNMLDLLQAIFKNIAKTPLNNINFDDLKEYFEMISKIKLSKCRTIRKVTFCTPGKLLDTLKIFNLLIQTFIDNLQRNLNISHNLLEKLHEYENLENKSPEELNKNPELLAKIRGIEKKPEFAQLKKLLLLKPKLDRLSNLKWRITGKETKEKEELKSLYASYTTDDITINKNNDKILDTIEQLLNYDMTDDEKNNYLYKLKTIHTRNSCDKTIKLHILRCRQASKLKDALNKKKTKIEYVVPGTENSDNPIYAQLPNSVYGVATNNNVYGVANVKEHVYENLNELGLTNASSASVPPLPKRGLPGTVRRVNVNLVDPIRIFTPPKPPLPLPREQRISNNSVTIPAVFQQQQQQQSIN